VGCIVEISVSQLDTGRSRVAFAAIFTAELSVYVTVNSAEIVSCRARVAVNCLPLSCRPIVLNMFATAMK